MAKTSDLDTTVPPLKVWKKVFVKTFFAIGEKRLDTLAAGIAFFGTLSFFPFMAALVAIGGIVLEPHQMNDIANAVGVYLPSDIANLITTQLTHATQDKSSNGIIAIGAVILAIFGISGAVTTAISATNAAYGIQETRNAIKLRITSMVWTFIILVLIQIMLPLLFVGNKLLTNLQIPAETIALYGYLRWIILFVLLTIGLALFYHYGPNRARTKFQWLSWGALTATLLWIFVTALFFVYLQYFANFSNSYSLFAGIIAMMMWLNFSSLAILVGAEVNYQLERTKRKR
jgi:membrane protein